MSIILKKFFPTAIILAFALISIGCSRNDVANDSSDERSDTSISNTAIITEKSVSDRSGRSSAIPADFQ